MKVFYLLLIGLIIFGCQNKNIKEEVDPLNEIKYSYNEIEITRHDYYGRTEFYYGEKDSLNTGVIWAEYSGINDHFKGYLEFKENGKVFLLSGDGYFQSKNVDTSKFEYKRIYSYNKPADTAYVCEIWLSIGAEKEWNSNRNTKINFTYPLNPKEQGF